MSAERNSAGVRVDGLLHALSLSPGLPLAPEEEVQRDFKAPPAPQAPSHQL